MYLTGFLVGAFLTIAYNVVSTPVGSLLQDEPLPLACILSRKLGKLLDPLAPEGLGRSLVIYLWSMAYNYPTR